MAMTDPIANFLTVLRNALKARKPYVDCPSSKMLEEIAGILKKEGFIKNCKKIEDDKQGMLRVYLKYAENREKTPAITRLERISRPGLRVYKNKDDIKPVLSGLGIALITTSKGIKTDKECTDQGIGGELLCRIW